MPNYYIVKYLLENWIIHSLFLREAGDGLLALARVARRRVKKEEKQPGEGEEQRERERRGPVSRRKEPRRSGGGWAKIWLTHGVHNGLPPPRWRRETKPQKTPVNGSQYAETAAE